tara:strand:- start:17157 stop:17462 length:306 start_codon:yes stop_codon:yes gene_type:complete
MSYTVTTKDLDRIFEIYATEIAAAGGVPDGARLILSHGSQTYGRAFRVNLTGDGTKPDVYNSGHFKPLIGNDYLGMTKYEADQTLRTVLRVLWDVNRIQNA